MEKRSQKSPRLWPTGLFQAPPAAPLPFGAVGQATGGTGTGAVEPRATQCHQHHPLTKYSLEGGLECFLTLQKHRTTNDCKDCTSMLLFKEKTTSACQNRKVRQKIESTLLRFLESGTFIICIIWPYFLIQLCIYTKIRVCIDSDFKLKNPTWHATWW